VSRHQGPFWLDPQGDPCTFPAPHLALREPDGLLAVGGDLSPQRLLCAYRIGIFPWYSEGQPILWWTPDPRTVLFPAGLHVSRSLRKWLRQRRYRFSLDTAFATVLEACAAPRADGLGTWLLPEMRAAYQHLHELGFAHSVEVWEDAELIGGLYGLALGGVFFGESMFSRRPNASKVALVHLVRQLEAWGFALLDAQVASDHLFSLGAEEIPRERFMALLDEHADRTARPGPWRLELEVVDG